MTNDLPVSIAEGKHLRLVSRGHWEYAERTVASGAVMIVAVTADGRVLFVEQHRIPLGCAAIELPAGLVGDLPEDVGEPLARAAQRELIEETGYTAERLEMVGTFSTSAGLTSETVTLFFAHGLRRVGAGGGDHHEQIIVHEIPWGDVDTWLAEQAAAGKVIASTVYTGLYFVSRAAKR
ncbi:MAG: NUDIX hydrolase [Pirellulales bacterium]|nr:NUDIX hydrolase [Pirellulales bacterium]